MQSNQAPKPYVYIATPMFMNMCCASYANSVIHLTHAFRNVGYNCHYNFIMNQSTIEKNRNELAALFLLQPEATHLLFIDADVSFDPDDVVRMLQADVDIIAGAYPIKNIDWKNYKQAVRNNMTGHDLNYAAFKYSFIDHTDTVKLNINKQSMSMMEVEAAGTGLMLIKRHVIEKLAAMAPHYITRVVDVENVSVPYLFKAGMDEHNRFETEDVYFCNNWRKLGGKIHVAHWPKVVHTGSFEYGRLDE